MTSETWGVCEWRMRWLLRQIVNNFKVKFTSDHWRHHYLPVADRTVTSAVLVTSTECDTTRKDSPMHRMSLTTSSWKVSMSWWSCNRRSPAWTSGRPEKIHHVCSETVIIKTLSNGVKKAFNKEILLTIQINQPEMTLENQFDVL